MASYQKRGNSWRVIVRRKGQTATGTFDTKALAEEWALRVESQIIDNGETPVEAVKVVKANDTSMADLMARYATEVSPGKRGTRWEQIRLRMLARDFDVFARPAVEITGPDMADWRDARLRKVAASSVNRELNLISAVFNQSMKEWRVGLVANPVHLVTRPRNPKARTQRVSSADRDAIIAKLGWDEVSVPETSKQWVAFAFALSLATAMRKGEVLALTWENIHLAERYAHLPMTKNGDERDVPLSSVAVALIKVAGPKMRGRVVPVESGNLDKLFRDARREIGRMHVRFHDSRRESLTQMSTKLSNVLELAAVSGHRSLQVLKGYYAPKPGDLAAKLG